ncbi:hypothetical protein ACP8HI_02580 [Paenibacillus sp. FA6]|uniref:hypothetical protein n=1 Tax=Paenibacillus sp. FA6 TaxID=3413029 RepID=UPI003F655ED7
MLLTVACTTGPWILIYTYSLFEKNPPKPTYTYGEFPFYLEYEINGQRMIVDDKVIVEFDGFGFEGGIGSDKTIKWKQTLASGNEEVILFENEEPVRIFLTIREEDYNMEDMIENSGYNYLFPNVIKEEKVGRGKTATSLSENELINNYKIRLIEFKYGEEERKIRKKPHVS